MRNARPHYFIRRTRREDEGLNPSEHTEAARLIRCANAHLDEAPELEWLFAIPNGGWRKKAVAKKLKAEGVKPGVHDYLLPVPRQGFAGLFVELKSLDGHGSKEQREFAVFVRSQGYRAEFAKGGAEAWRIISEYLGIRTKPAWVALWASVA